MASPSIIDDPAQASRRAKMRIGVAVALLVTAIGILAILNQRKAPETQPLPASAPALQTSISSQEAEHPADLQPQQLSEVTSPAPRASEPVPPPPVPGTLPAAPAPKHPQAVESAEKTGGKTVSSHAEQAPAPKAPEPVTPKQAAIEPAKASEPVKPGVPKEFEVQLGVFGDMENARQLQAKLAEHGIPSHSETRVQVGPFKTRAEADQAREKLKALGITAVIAPK